MTTANGKQITTVALYARVSTADKGQDPEMQLREMRTHAQQKGLIVIEEYTDHGISGSKSSRPELDRMMADFQAARFDAVMVWKLDRFSRSLKHLIASIETLDGKLMSVRDNLDLTTPAGRLMFAMVGAFAEFEREITRERVKAGLRNAVAKGKTLGRKRRDDIDFEQIRQLRAAGTKWREIQRITGVPLTTCYRACSKDAA